jgi:hypothetical protein
VTPTPYAYDHTIPLKYDRKVPQNNPTSLKLCGQFAIRVLALLFAFQLVTYPKTTEPLRKSIHHTASRYRTAIHAHSNRMMFQDIYFCALELSSSFPQNLHREESQSHSTPLCSSSASHNLSRSFACTRSPLSADACSIVHMALAVSLVYAHKLLQCYASSVGD